MHTRFSFVPVRANTFFEGDDDDTLAGGGGADTLAGGGGADTLSGGGGGGGKKQTKLFTQEELERHVKNRLKKKDEETATLLEELEGLKLRGLTPENQAQLEARIESLQNEGKSKAQIAAENEGKLKKKFESDLKAKDTEVGTWKGLYESYRSKAEIVSAAQEYDAENSDQLYQILKPSTKFVALTGEDGKPTGEYEPRVTLQDKDKDDKPITLELTVTDAVKRMKEMKVHANLFKSGASGGLGGYNNGRKTGTGNTTVPTNTAAFMEARKKDKNLIQNAGTNA